MWKSKSHLCKGHTCIKETGPRRLLNAYCGPITYDPHPTIVKKMKTFLEVENKMGTMIQSSRPINQTRPPLSITNPNVNRSENAERRQ